MANNRMIVCYRPSGRCFFIAKRMAFGWYHAGGHDDPALAARWSDFLEACARDAAERGASQDDFALLMEDAEGAPKASGDWTRKGEADGFMHVKLPPEP